MKKIDKNEIFYNAEIAFRNKDWKSLLIYANELIKVAQDDAKTFFYLSKAYFELKKYDEAINISYKGIEKFPNDSGCFAVYVETFVTQGKYQEAIQLYDKFRNRFPLDFRSYVNPANLLIKSSNFNKADELIRQGMIYLPNNKSILTSYANIAKAKNDYLSLLERASLFIYKFPEYSDGYFFLCKAHFELKQYSIAESLCNKLINRFPKDVGIFAVYCEIALRTGKNFEAIKRYTQFRNNFPTDWRSYINVIPAYLKTLRFKQADELCLLGIERVSKNINIYLRYAENAMYSHDYNEAEKRYEQIIKKFPDDWRSYICLAVVCNKIKKFDKSDEMCLLAIKKFPNIVNCYIRYAENAMDKFDYNEASERWRVLRNLFPENKSGYIRGIASEIKLGNYDLLKQYYCDNNNENIKSKKFCFLFIDGNLIKYYIQLLNKFETLDIIVLNNNIKERLLLFKINKFNIIVGIENLINYDFVIVDIQVGNYNQYIKNFKNINIIGLKHGVDFSNISYSLNKICAFICSSKNQIYDNNFIKTEFEESNMIEMIKKIDIKKKCEISYTGPINIDSSYENKYKDRNYKIQYLEDYLKTKLDKNKLTLFILEDEITLFGQIVYACNKLSKYFNIILKPWHSLNDKKLNHINDNITVIKERNLSPNEIRYSSDIILSGFDSGTFISSIMQNLIVIPYFSRITAGKILNLKQSFKTFTMEKENILNSEHKTSKLLVQKFFLQNDKFYDILNVKDIINTINNNEYKDWYNENIKILKNIAFEDYNTSNPAYETYENIMYFIKNNTFGRKCNYIYLK